MFIFANTSIVFINEKDQYEGEMEENVSCFIYRYFNDYMFNVTLFTKRESIIRWMNSNVINDLYNN